MVITMVTNMVITSLPTLDEKGVRPPASTTCTGFGVREWKLITACFWPV